MSRRGKGSNSFSNSFAALSLHEEQEPKKVLQLQSSRSQKKLEYQSRKALYGSGPSSSSAPQQKHKGQQQQHTGRVSQTAGDLPSSSSSSPESPGFLAALAAIQEAEQQQREEEEAMFWSQAASQAPSGPCSLSPSPSNHSEFAAWHQVAADSGNDPDDPWGTPTSTAHHLPQQQQQQAMLSCSPSSSAASPPQLQLQQAAEGHSADCGWQVLAISRSQAYSWRAFAMSFAEAARAAGDEDAADGALAFGVSDVLTAAALSADDAAAAELEGVVAQATAAGLTPQELVQAQQAELLLQIDRRTKQRGPAWRQLTFGADWGCTSSSSSNAAKLGGGNNSSSNTSSRAASPVRSSPQQLLPDVSDEGAFPGLEADSSSGSSWQQVGCSPHMVPRGWKGGRLAPKAKGIKLLNTTSSASSNAACGGQAERLRPSALDLHWDLRMDGLAPMQREEDASSCSTDPWGVGGAGSGGGPTGGLQHGSEQAAERTRQLLAEQEASAAAGVRPNSSGRDRLGADTVRNMMEKAASKGARLAATNSSSSNQRTEESSAVEAEESGGLCGSKLSFTYSWSAVFKSALLAGWEPVSKVDGGGGSHFKLRRVLLVSGVTQTMVLPCTPSDSQRGVRNVAAAFKKREDEKLLLESKAAAELQTAAQAGKQRVKRNN